MLPMGLVSDLGALLCPLGLLCAPLLKRACPPCVHALGSYYASWGSFMPHGALVHAPPMSARPPLHTCAPWALITPLGALIMLLGAHLCLLGLIYAPWGSCACSLPMSTCPPPMCAPPPEACVPLLPGVRAPLPPTHARPLLLCVPLRQSCAPLKEPCASLQQPCASFREPYKPQPLQCNGNFYAAIQRGSGMAATMD
jgi:hypothetical protein